MAGDVDIHDRIHDEIELQLQSLRVSAPAVVDGAAWSEDEVQRKIADLELDMETLLDHWRTEDGTHGDDGTPNARACGNPQPCPHTLGLAQKYGLV